MNNKIKSEKYRKLSIAALVTGIIADGLAVLNLLGKPFFNLISGMPVVLGLSIAAVVCGSIDLKRIQAGRDLSPKNWSKLKVSIWASKIEKRRKGLCQENATHQNKLLTP